MTQPIKVTWSGRPLEDLTRLIGIRCKVLHDTTENAVCATAVTALKSIRAMTRVAKAERIKDRDITVVDRTSELVPGYAKGKRVVRIGGEHGNYLTGTPRNLPGGLGKIKFLSGKYAKGEKPRVFWARYSPPWSSDAKGIHRQIRIGYFVADKEADVRSWMKRKIRRHVKKTGKLAKNTIGVAINRIASRNATLEGSSYARQVAQDFAHVKIGNRGQNQYAVTFLDGLDYSLSAVKGGKAGVDLAIKKAANLMAGRINMYAQKMMQAGTVVEAPFPEIRRIK